MSPLLFAGAPRFHNGAALGLKSDEVPAIQQKGEVVLPKGSSQGGDITVSIPVTISAPGADPAQLQRLTSAVKSLQSTLPGTVVRVVRDARPSHTLMERGAMDFIDPPSTWVAGLDDEPGVRLKVRSFIDVEFEEEITRRTRLVQRRRSKQIGHGELKRLLTNFLIDVAIERVLVDWSGVYDEAGRPIPFSADAARAKLKCERFRAAVIQASIKLDCEQVPGHIALGLS